MATDVLRAQTKDVRMTHRIPRETAGLKTAREVRGVSRWHWALLLWRERLEVEVPQRLRELGCVVVGHAWKVLDWPPHQAGAFKWCRRCYRRDMNL